VRIGNQQYWSIPNAGEPSDHRLISPIFAVKGQSFGLSYRHRWAFESDDRRKKDFDGGVVEISVDGGKTWKDASEYGDVDYNVTLDNDAQGSNPLKGRRAYGRTSEGYPDKWVTSNLTLTLDAPSTDVALRFRAGADDNTGEAGWDVDDIALTGIDGKPFWSLVAHRDLCDEAGPRVNAGENKTVRSGAQVALTGTGTHPKNAALTFAWTQVDGPAITLAGSDSPTLSFTAPKAETPPRTYTFALRANDGALLSPASRVTVTVDDSAGPDTALPAISGGGCGCHSAGNETGSGLSSLAVAGAVMAFVRRRRRDRA
jgi:MYXO-CTERM domain-containing protein